MDTWIAILPAYSMLSSPESYLLHVSAPVLHFLFFPFSILALLQFFSLFFLFFLFFFFLSLIGLLCVCLDRPIHHSTILRDKPFGSKGEIDRVRPEGDGVCRLSSHFHPLFSPVSLLSSLPLLSVYSRDVSFWGWRRRGNVDTLVRLLVQQAASMPVNGPTSIHTHIHAHKPRSDICNMQYLWEGKALSDGPSSKNMRPVLSLQTAQRTSTQALWSCPAH